MKVRVTLDISDTDRTIIGMVKHGEWQSATREEIIEVVEASYNDAMKPARRAWDERNKLIMDEIRRSLDGDDGEEE